MPRGRAGLQNEVCLPPRSTLDSNTAIRDYVRSGIWRCSKELDGERQIPDHEGGGEMDL